MNHNNKLTFEQAEDIRRLYASGEVSQDKLARLYKISQATIYNIVNNKTYVKSECSMKQ
jgi:DNA invertase Pin-like site-specific DNA recombinase